MTILVVDDDDALRHLTCRMLGLEGLTAVAAPNGAEAMAYLQGGGSADAILLDLRMPVMDGWAFRRAQRNDARLVDIPVVILAGADLDRFAEIEAAAAFQKPAQLSDVVDALRRIIESARTSARPATTS